jgi:Xaa-Pro dipeptidase
MDLPGLGEAIRSSGLDGWLFHNFSHRDPLSDAILGIDPEALNSRRWVYALGADSPPLKIVHVIERLALASLPGREIVYDSYAGFVDALSAIKPGRWACHVSPTLPVVSTMDAGTYLLLLARGIEPVDAGALVQRAFGLLSEAGMASHESAAKKLYAVVAGAWGLISSAHRDGRSLREGDVRDWILGEFASLGLVTDHPPIVAAGSSSADPHYSSQGAGRAFEEGDPVQLDIWAKETGTESIYADISWIGVFSRSRVPAFERGAEDLFALRDEALSFIVEALGRGNAPTGSEVDARVRALAASKGLSGALRHRTGHGIDRECHGSGVNLDSVEFPDERRILPGSCFSIEPGLYFERHGFRTEIDAYRLGDSLRVSGGRPQDALLYCGEP